MQIHVHNNGQSLGPFPLAAFHEMVRLGSLPDTAVVWYEGAPDWVPLPTFLQQHPLPAAPAAAAAAVAPSPTRPAAVTPQMLAAARAQTRGGQEISDVQRVMRAGVAGGASALIGGAVWAGIAIALSVELGYVAWGIGLLCGFAISKFGRGHGVVFQIMAVVCSLVGIGIGKIGFAMSAGFLSIRLFDLLFIGLAMVSAWRMAGGGDD